MCFVKIRSIEEMKNDSAYTIGIVLLVSLRPKYCYTPNKWKIHLFEFIASIWNKNYE